MWWGGKELSEGQDKESVGAFQGVKKHFRREGEAQTELPVDRPTVRLSVRAAKL